MPDNSWSEWHKHVLAELDRLTRSNEDVKNSLNDFKIYITGELVKKSEMVEFRSYVDEVKKDVARIEKDHAVELTSLRTELNSKAGVWGALAGAIPATVVLLVIFIEYMMK
jgi:hypothetical protein